MRIWIRYFCESKCYTTESLKGAKLSSKHEVVCDKRIVSMNLWTCRESIIWRDNLQIGFLFSNPISIFIITFPCSIIVMTT